MAPSGPLKVRVRAVVVTAVRPSSGKKRSAWTRMSAGWVWLRKKWRISGNAVPLRKYVLHPLRLLERLGGIAMELDADRPLARRHVVESSRVRADLRRLDEP